MTIVNFRPVTIPLTDAFSLSRYQHVILPSILQEYQHLSSSQSQNWLAIEACIEEEIVGLAIMEVVAYHFATKLVRLHSLVIHPFFRQQKIGQRLLHFTQEFAKNHLQALAIGVYFKETQPFIAIFLKMLQKQNWSKPFLDIVRCTFDIYSFDAKWLHYSYNLPPSYQILSWSEITQKDVLRINYLIKQRNLLPYLNPLQEESLIDTSSTFFLYKENQLIGWSVTNRLDAHTLSYAAVWVESQQIPFPFGIALIVSSILAHKKLIQVPHATLEINRKYIENSWWKFVKKRLIPFTKDVDYLFWSSLSFK